MTARTELGPSPIDELVSAIEGLSLESRRNVAEDVTECGVYAALNGDGDRVGGPLGGKCEAEFWAALLRLLSSVRPAEGEQLAIDHTDAK